MSSKVYCKDLTSGTNTEVPKEELNLRIAVYGVLLKNNNILLTRGRHGYVLPGGAVELGEGLEQALTREVFEETGLQIEAGSIIGATQDFYISAYDHKAYQSVSLIFECVHPEGEISTAQFSDYEKEFYQKAEWVSLSESAILKTVYPTLTEEALNKCRV